MRFLSLSLTFQEYTEGMLFISNQINRNRSDQKSEFLGPIEEFLRQLALTWTSSSNQYVR